MSIEQVQIFILDGALLGLLSVVWLMEGNAQKLAKKVQDLEEISMHISTGSIMGFLMGAESKKRVVKAKKAIKAGRPRKNKAKHLDR